MLNHDVTEDAWVNEELRGPLAGVFGPLLPEPARVPPLEFDVDEETLRMRTYGNTQPVRLPVSSPHGQDVIDAQWDELKNYNVLVETYPDIGPGTIANIAFTVAKPGVTRVKRPIGFQRNVIPADLLLRQYMQHMLLVLRPIAWWSTSLSMNLSQFSTLQFLEICVVL
jgi:hypothetical protein